MRILALDSSGLVASVAVVEDGAVDDQVIAEYTVNYKKTHSQTLLPMLDEIVKMTELDLHTVDAIAVAGGPGSFTGLRIGSATAKGLGLALEKPLIHIPTLEGLAYNLCGIADVVCPIMDARRGQVYAGIYEFDGQKLHILEDQMAVPIEELAEKFDESFVQPLDQNDNTGEKNELASLIGSFNPAWDAKGNHDDAFFHAVSMAGMILESKFERFRGNERADRKIEEILEAHDDAVEEGKCDERILILPEFVPCQKRLSETEIAFVIFPSNRGGYCIQPQKKEFSMNYKCAFPEAWLGLEGEALQKATGLSGAGFCHKGGFLMSTENLEDAVKACEISLKEYVEAPCIVCYGTCDEEVKELLHMLPEMKNVTVHEMPLSEPPEMETDGIYGEVLMEKQEWKKRIKVQVKEILKYKPEAVCVNGNVFSTYPVVHALRKKHVPVLTIMENDEEKLIVRIPSGS